MRNISIINHDFKHPENWTEISIKKAIDLWSIVTAIPIDYLKSYQLVSEQPTDLRSQEMIDKEYTDLMIELECSGFIENEVYKFQMAIVSCMCNIPIEILCHVPRRGDGSVEQVYLMYSQKFVLEMLSENATFGVDEVYNYFTFKGEKYYMPDIEQTIGKLKYLANTTIEEYANASDLMLLNSEDEKAKIRTCGYNIQKNRYDNLPLLIAILCKKKDEVFDEKTVLSRSKEFEDLPVNIAFTVFFYLLKHGTTYLTYINMLSAKALLQATRKQIAHFQK